MRRPFLLLSSTDLDFFAEGFAGDAEDAGGRSLVAAGFCHFQ